MQKMIDQFTKGYAPAVLARVKAQVTPDMDEQQVMALIHEQIISSFEARSALTVAHLTSGPDERQEFAGLMYDLLAPLAKSMGPAPVNPVYAEYVSRTGKTGALNFITGRGVD